MLYDLLRPLLFQLPAERAHGLGVFAMKAGLFSRAARSLASSQLAVSDPALKSRLFGIDFPNPVGLAAGFDKSGESFNALGSLGFGFIEIGTVTALAQPGNPPPRLFRLPADGALLNRMGFNNPGAEAVAEHLKHQAIEPILGINIGKSKVTPNEDAPKDYLRSLELLEPFAKYIVINVSSPNTPNLRALQDAGPLRELLRLMRQRSTRPVLVKIAPDLTESQLDELIGVVTDEKIAGIIATNTTISREDLKTDAKKVESLGAGGISGAPLTHRSRAMVRRIYHLTNGALPIIGVGGIRNAEDAFEMIRAGASLVQIYTGFIYGGPAIVSKINRGLLALLRAKGLNSIEQAIGLAHREKE